MAEEAMLEGEPVPEARRQEQEILFAALLRPNLSLDGRGFRLLMWAVAAVGIPFAAGFLLVGAWPVAGFLGVEYLLLLFAFRISFRRARLREHLELTREDLTVRRIDSRGDEQRWRFQPYWLRVEIEDPERSDSRLLLMSHGRSLAIGSFLSREERAGLAEALKEALARLDCRPAPLAS